MQITCPSCAARYVLSPAALGEKGRTVRCAKCSNTWFAERLPEKEPEKTPDSVPAPDPMIEAATDFSAELRASMAAPVTSFSLAIPKRKTKIQLPGFVRTDFKRLPRKILMIMGGLVLALALIAAILWISLSREIHPQAETPAGIASYSGKELVFADVKATAEKTESSYVLTLRGSVQNNTNRPVELPALSARLLSRENSQSVEWIFHLPQTSLAPGEKASFEISKPDLKFIGNQVSLSFVLDQ